MAPLCARTNCVVKLQISAQTINSLLIIEIMFWYKVISSGGDCVLGLTGRNAECDKQLFHQPLYDWNRLIVNCVRLFRKFRIEANFYFMGQFIHTLSIWLIGYLLFGYFGVLRIPLFEIQAGRRHLPCGGYSLQGFRLVYWPSLFNEIGVWNVYRCLNL